MSVRHKPLFRSRLRERVQRNRQIDRSGRRNSPYDLERTLSGRCPRASAQSFVADKLADRVVARTRKSQLLDGFSYATPRLGGRLVVPIVRDDQRVQPWIEAADGEAHPSIVPKHLRTLRNDFAAKDESLACV